MNAGKTTNMTCATGLDLLQRSGNFTCAICRTGVGSDTDACTMCTRSVVDSIVFKRAQTTGALHI